MMNVGLMRMMVVVVMVNDNENDFHFLNYNDHDHGHDRDLLNVDFVVCIVWQLHDDHKNIDPNNDKNHDEDNTDKVMSF
jgi:hypothetical protein